MTPTELSQATGTTYTSIQSVNNATLCNVTATAVTDSFSFSIAKESSANSWASQVDTINSDDGSSTPVSGIGDQAVRGGVKEFAAEAKGYIVVVINADVNNAATAQDFTRSKKIALALIAKL